MGVDAYGARIHIDAQHVVAGVIGYQHKTFAVEADAVADAACGQVDKNTALACGRDFADCALALVVDGVEIPFAITTGAFNTGGEAVGFGQLAADI